MDKMQETNTAVTAKKVRIITSKNSPELAAKIKLAEPHGPADIFQQQFFLKMGSKINDCLFHRRLMLTRQRILCCCGKAISAIQPGKQQKNTAFDRLFVTAFPLFHFPIDLGKESRRFRVRNMTAQNPCPKGKICFRK